MKFVECDITYKLLIYEQNLYRDIVSLVATENDIYKDFLYISFSFEGIEYKWNRELRRKFDRPGSIAKTLVHERRNQKTLSGDKNSQYWPKIGSIVAGGRCLR